ncbi:MAG: hypothetical protein AAGJ37_16515 [Pseudomonadota bacterium]
MFNPNLRSLHAKSRFGWAIPFVNFAGKGFCFNLGARPRTPWDFNAKIHDLMYFANDLRFSTKTPNDPLERSRLEKADYIFRQLNPLTETTFPETIYKKVAKLIFTGDDKSQFKPGDNFVNVIDNPAISLERGHFMIPWSEIPEREQEEIEEQATFRAKDIVKDESLTYIREEYDLYTRKRFAKKAGTKNRRLESNRDRDNRLVKDIARELMFNSRASVDVQPWREWAAEKFGDTWEVVRRV